jgi:hypothetical protein
MKTIKLSVVGQPSSESAIIKTTVCIRYGLDYPQWVKAIYSQMYSLQHPSKEWQKYVNLGGGTL